MLKPADPQARRRPNGPIGELVHELIEDGKAYARAEVGLAKAIATAKGKALALPAALFATAFMLALAAVTPLPSASCWRLRSSSGRSRPALSDCCSSPPWPAVGWYGVQRLKRDL